MSLEPKKRLLNRRFVSGLCFNLAEISGQIDCQRATPTSATTMTRPEILLALSAIAVTVRAVRWKRERAEYEAGPIQRQS